MHLGRTGCTAEPWRCAALSYKLHFYLLLTENTNNVTSMLHCKVNTSCKDTNHATSCIGKLPRELPRVLLARLRLVDKPNEDHPLVQTHVNQPSKGANCETSKQTHVQPLLQYITEATEAPISESGKALGHTQFHCADAFHLTLRVEGLDAVKHHARRTFLGQVVRTCHDEHQVDASACCIHDEPSILVSGICTAVSAFKLTLTRPRL